MGCYLSKKLPRDSNVRIFRVYNVNDLGAEISPGKIEVTENDLILYQKGKDPIRWPLRALRRYGFDEELFSFESGRRCTTGSGIYAFKCRRAEELFNLVQESIQNVGQHAHLRTSQTLFNGNTTGSGRQNSRPTSVIDPHEPSGIHLSGNGRVNVVPNDQHLYMNGSLLAQEESAPNYINTGAARAENNTSESMDHRAALLDFLHNPPMAPKPPKPETSNFPVNYVDLDLPGSNENLSEQCEGACAMDTQTNANGGQANADLMMDQPDGLLAVEVDEVALNYADLDVFTDSPAEETNQPTYINLDSDGNFKDYNKSEQIKTNKSNGENGCIRKNLLVRKLSIEQNYANVGAASKNSCPDSAPVILAQPPVVSMNTNANRLSNPGELNYIVIDVNKTDGDVTPGATAAASTSMSYAVPDSPNKRTESYAMIDFNRTFALSTSAKPVSDDGEGLRKTRHNSTIN